jgi:lysophospholipase
MSEMVSGWQLEKDMVLPGGINPLKNAKFLDAVHDTAKLKEDVGFNISLTDHWGRAIGYHFLPGTSSESLSHIAMISITYASLHQGI